MKHSNRKNKLLDNNDKCTKFKKLDVQSPSRHVKTYDKSSENICDLNLKKVSLSSNNNDKTIGGNVDFMEEISDKIDMNRNNASFHSKEKLKISSPVSKRTKALKQRGLPYSIKSNGQIKDGSKTDTEKIPNDNEEFVHIIKPKKIPVPISFNEEIENIYAFIEKTNSNVNRRPKNNDTDVKLDTNMRKLLKKPFKDANTTTISGKSKQQTKNISNDPFKNSKPENSAVKEATLESDEQLPSATPETCQSFSNYDTAKSESSAPVNIPDDSLVNSSSMTSYANKEVNMDISDSTPNLNCVSYDNSSNSLLGRSTLCEYPNTSLNTINMKSSETCITSVTPIYASPQMYPSVTPSQISSVSNEIFIPDFLSLCDIDKNMGQVSSSVVHSMFLNSLAPIKNDRSLNYNIHLDNIGNPISNELCNIPVSEKDNDCQPYITYPSNIAANFCDVNNINMGNPDNIYDRQHLNPTSTNIEPITPALPHDCKMSQDELHLKTAEQDVLPDKVDNFVCPQPYLPPTSSKSRSSKSKPPPKTSISVNNINSHFICQLCAGYFVDATSIIVCLHTCEYFQ